MECGKLRPYTLYRWSAFFRDSTCSNVYMFPGNKAFDVNYPVDLDETTHHHDRHTGLSPDPLPKIIKCANNFHSLQQYAKTSWLASCWAQLLDCYDYGSKRWTVHAQSSWSFQAQTCQRSPVSCPASLPHTFET
jgi:hypothetical protein